MYQHIHTDSIKSPVLHYFPLKIIVLKVKGAVMWCHVFKEDMYKMLLHLICKINHGCLAFGNNKQVFLDKDF